MTFCRLTGRCLAALVVIVLVAASAAAQSTGQISGIIKDGSGGVLPGVTVTITNAATGIARNVVTDERGAYVVTNLPVGTYTVSAELQGFRQGADE